MVVRVVAVVLSLVLPFLSSCIHLVQPQTYRSGQPVERMQEDYLINELVLGLPEETFKRWYTRDDSWVDPHRPYILKVTRKDDEATVYSLGQGTRTAGEVVFKDGALDHWEYWHLLQESVASLWVKKTPVPRSVDAGTLARIAGLDLQYEPLRLDEIAKRPCDTDSGDVVETVTPLMFDRRHGNRIDITRPGPSSAADEGRFGILPVGTRLTALKWNPIEGQRVRGDDGTEYRLEYVMGLSDLGPAICPPGQCIPNGKVATLARDLVVAVREGSEPPALAVDETISRVPVWMDRVGTLKAGSQVKITRWPACEQKAILIERIGRDEAGLPRALTVPAAPPGLFVPEATQAVATSRSGS